MRFEFLSLKIALLMPLVALGNCGSSGGARPSTPLSGGGSGVTAEFETIRRLLPDGIIMTADLYRVPETSANAAPEPKPVLVCMHMTASSRGEYRRIAPEMIARNFHVLAVDLRCGGEGENADRLTGVRSGVMNETWNMARQVLGHAPSYFEAYPDVVQAVAWAHELFPTSRVGLVGSSYSASLALVFAADYPNQLDAVAAFSPGEYMPPWNIAQRAQPIQVPTYITCGNTLVESNHAKPIANGIANQSLVRTLWPQDEGWVGDHGSKALLIHHPPSRAEEWARFTAAMQPLFVPQVQR